MAGRPWRIGRHSNMTNLKVPSKHLKVPVSAHKEYEISAKQII